MKVTTFLEVLSPYQRKLTVTVPAEIINEVIYSVFGRIQKNSPGSSLESIMADHQESLKLPIFSDVVGLTFPEALNQQGISPASRPDFTSSDVTVLGKPYVYEATFDIWPTLPVIDLSKLKDFYTDRDKLFEQLLEENEVKIPEKLLEEYVEFEEGNKRYLLRRQWEDDGFRGRDHPPSLDLSTRKSIHDGCLKMLQLFALTNAIALQNSLPLSDETPKDYPVLLQTVMNYLEEVRKIKFS